MTSLEKHIRKYITRSDVLRRKFRETLSKSNERDRIGGFGSVLKQAVKRSTLKTRNGEVYFFDDDVYKSITFADLDTCLINVLESLGVSDSDIVNSRSKMLAAAKDGLSMKVLQLDSRKLCFRNCVLDLDTFTTSGFSHKHGIVYKIDYDFDLDNRKVDVWTRFLDRSLPDKQLQLVLQEAMGSVLVKKGASKQEKIFCLWGFGQNGKSVIQDALRGVLGGDNNYFSAIAMKDLVNECNGHFNVDRIVGKLVNFCSDVSANIFSSEKAKIIISRETILASKKKMTPYETDDLPVQFCCLNKLPETSDFAENRRVMVIPFYTSIPSSEVDPALCNKLRDEYPGILNWMISGARRYVNNGYKFTRCEAVNNVLLEYKKLTSPPLNFMLSSGWTTSPASYLKDPDKRITPHALYKEYLDFCEKTNIAVVSEYMFVKAVMKAGYKKDRDEFMLYYY